MVTIFRPLKPGRMAVYHVQGFWFAECPSKDDTWDGDKPHVRRQGTRDLPTTYAWAQRHIADHINHQHPKAVTQ